MITKSRLEELIEQGATIYEAKYGKELPNINRYYMYVCFRKFREQLTHQTRR